MPVTCDSRLSFPCLQGRCLAVLKHDTLGGMAICPYIQDNIDEAAAVLTSPGSIPAHMVGQTTLHRLLGYAELFVDHVRQGVGWSPFTLCASMTMVRHGNHSQK